jgi:hypothetical protein
MKRDKAWWARLDAPERWKVWNYERFQHSGTGHSSYYPDDCGECPVCGEMKMGVGPCTACDNEYMALIAKASGGVVK